MPGTAGNNESKASAELQDRHQAALDWIFGRINYERAKTGTFSARDFKLDRMAELLRRLGDPQKSIPVVHIAGTKGKGSTATMTASILQAAGYKTGLFTSPHLDRFEERMTVNGVEPVPADFVEMCDRCRIVVQQMDTLDSPMPPTYFEIATALAWLYFTAQKCDIAVLEVGLGGRLDSTNICTPEVCVITSISLDHTAVLGDTLALIAAEKSGIIKRGVPVVSGATSVEARETIVTISEQNESSLWQLGDEIAYQPAKRNGNEAAGDTMINVQTPLNQWKNILLPLPGDHQARNLSLVLSVIDRLNQRPAWTILQQHVHAGLAKVHCPVRIEVVGRDPLVILDAAHNEASCQALVETLNQSFPQRPRTLVYATTGGKELKSMLKVLLPEFDTIVVTQYSGNPRFVPLKKIERVLSELDPAKKSQIEYCQHVNDAWKTATAAKPAMICVTGSFFLAVEVRELLTK